MENAALVAEKPRFIRERSFYHTLLTIAVPIVLQNIVVFLTQMLDTVMLGELGDVAMTASSLANQPFFIFNMLTFGLGSGAAVIRRSTGENGKSNRLKRLLLLLFC